MSWIRFRGHCPVCHGLRKDCRQNSETNLVHCRATEANPLDWVFRGTDSLGFGLWAHHADCEQWSQERRAQWQHELELKRQARKDQERAVLSKSLSAEERDREIRKILAQLSLTKKDRILLQKRGLTDSQIVQNGYRSITKWQKLASPVSNRLAGTNPEGDQLYNPCEGILCPVKDENGFYVGLRLYNPKNKENGIGKYIWLSSAKRGVTNKNQFGENPIAVHYPEEYQSYDKIGLAEGLEFKSAIAAERLGYPVIGFSGNNFASSPQTLNQVISHLQQTLQDLGNNKPLTFILLGDAGSVINQQVLKGYAKGVQLLRSWNQKVRYLWWNQITKDLGDIDEIDGVTLAQAEYITPKEFTKLAKKHCQLIKIDPWQEQKEAAKNHTWKQLTSLTAQPWLEVNTPHLDQIGLDEKLERGHIYLVKSAKATGKTKAVKPLTEEFTNIYSWFNRIALGREECHKLGLNYKDELGSFLGYIKAGFCANSAYQFSPKHLKNNGLLLGDESDQLLSYLFESICNKNGLRPAILKAFEAQLRATIAGNGIALFMSADNSDIEYEFLQQIAPAGCEVRVIVNHYQPPNGQVNFDLSPSPDGSIDNLVTNLKNGIPCFVIDDVKNGVRGCKSIAEYIRKTLPALAAKIVEINSDTSGSDEIREYLKNINQASKNTLLLICSPSVISGISIENGHFQRGYGFYNGILTAKDASQSLVRVRGLANLTVWAAEKGFTWAANRALTPSRIREYYQRNYEANSKYLSSFDVDYDPLTDEWSSPWFELYCKYAAYRNLSMTDLRARLREQLEAEGYKIVEINPSATPTLQTSLQQSWGQIQLERALAVAEANLLTDEQLEILSQSKDAPTPEEQLDLEKTLLLKRYGQALIDAVTYTDKPTQQVLTGYAALYLKDKGGQWYRQLQQLYYLLDPHHQAIASDRQRERQQERYGRRFAGDLSWNGRKRECRLRLGLSELIHTDWTNPEDFQQLAQIAKQNSRQIKDAIGLSVIKLTAAQIYTELVAQLGLKTSSTQSKQQLADGSKKTVRLKRITPESWELAQLFIAHRSELRLQRTTKNSEFNQPEIAVTPPLLFLSEEPGGVLPGQTHTGQTLEPPLEPPNGPSQKCPETEADDLSNEPSNESVHTTSDSLDSEEAIEDLTFMLSMVDSPQMLRILTSTEGFTRQRLNRAASRLPLSKWREIREWAYANQQLRSTA